jgi:hypothetical protein
VRGQEPGTISRGPCAQSETGTIMLLNDDRTGVPAEYGIRPLGLQRVMAKLMKPPATSCARSGDRHNRFEVVCSVRS